MTREGHRIRLVVVDEARRHSAHLSNRDLRRRVVVPHLVLESIAHFIVATLRDQRIHLQILTHSKLEAGIRAIHIAAAAAAAAHRNETHTIQSRQATAAHGRRELFIRNHECGGCQLDELGHLHVTVVQDIAVRSEAVAHLAHSSLHNHHVLRHARLHQHLIAHRELAVQAILVTHGLTAHEQNLILVVNANAVQLQIHRTTNHRHAAHHLNGADASDRNLVIREHLPSLVRVLVAHHALLHALQAFDHERALSVQIVRARHILRLVHAHGITTLQTTAFALYTTDCCTIGRTVIST